MMENGQTKVRTLQDIARIAGVSSSTVSRALQGSSLVNEDTRAKIEAIAKEHDFRPNLLARNLRLQRTNTIAFVIPSPIQKANYASDPFLLKFISLVITALQKRGFDMLITQVEEERTDVVERYVDSGRADGLIFLGRSSRNDQLLARARARTPVVMWGPYLPGEGFCSVGIDNIAAAEEATRHLIEQGRRRIALLGMQVSCLEPIHRYQGYARAIEQAGRSVDEALVVPGDYSGRSGYDGMKQLLALAPDVDAVFAVSDVLALGAMEALRENGRRIPDDVALVGFDNISQSAYVSPPLTTVSQNLAKAGATLLVDKLIRQIEGENVSGEVVPYHLIVRRSSGVASD